jgi:DNA/RNA-binding domain of Phe-tRNA-synthetase-like protein
VTDAEWLEFQKLAAQLARACEIIDAADKLAEAAHAAAYSAGYEKFDARMKLRTALDAFKVVRNGH